MSPRFVVRGNMPVDQIRAGLLPLGFGFLRTDQTLTEH